MHDSNFPVTKSSGFWKSFDSMKLSLTLVDDSNIPVKRSLEF